MAVWQFANWIQCSWSSETKISARTSRASLLRCRQKIGQYVTRQICARLKTKRSTPNASMRWHPLSMKGDFGDLFHSRDFILHQSTSYDWSSLACGQSFEVLISCNRKRTHRQRTPQKTYSGPYTKRLRWCLCWNYLENWSWTRRTTATNNISFEFLYDHSTRELDFCQRRFITKWNCLYIYIYIYIVN